jgi:hypothetical protein
MPKIKELLADNIVLHHNYRTGTITDFTDNSNDGTFVNTPPWRNTQHGRSLEFLGTDGISIADSAELQPTTMSVVVFGDFQSQTSGARLFSKRDGGGTHVEFFHNSATELSIYDGSNTRNATIDVIGAKMVAFTLVSGVAAEFYVDGVNAGTANSTSTITADDAPIIIGNNFAPNAPLENKVNEVLYFDIELTEDQISQLYDEWLQEAHMGLMPTQTRVPEIDMNFPDLVATWDMKIGSGAFTDLTGNGHEGSPEGAVINTKGIFGEAALLNGTDAYISVVDHADLSFGDSSSDSAFSVTAWIRVENAPFPMISKGVLNTDAEYRMELDNTGKILFRLFDESEADTYIGRKYDTALAQLVGRWAFASFTYDGSSTSAGMKIYVNGEQVDDIDDENGAYTAMEDLGGEFRIGRHDTAYAPGAIDAVRLWDTELSASEVVAMYQEASEKLDLYKPGFDWEETAVNVTGTEGFISNTGFEVGENNAGQWAVQASDGSENKEIASKTGATTLAGIKAAGVFGTWEWDMKKAETTEARVFIIANELDAVTGGSLDAYQLRFNEDERVALSRLDNGVDTALGFTDAAYIAVATWYTVRVTRTALGVFTMYILGGAFTDWTRVDAAGGGANPSAADLTYTSSSYLVIDFDADGDAIRNLKYWPTIQDPTA